MPLIATGDRVIKDSPHGNQFWHPSISHFASMSAQLVAGLHTMNLDAIKTFQDRFKLGTIKDVFFNQEKQLWNAGVSLASGVEASDLPAFCPPALCQINIL